MSTSGPGSPSSRVRRWHAQLGDRGRVEIRTSATKSVGVLLTGMAFAGVAITMLISTDLGTGSIVSFVFVAAFGLLGAGAGMVRLARPQIVTVELHGISFSRQAIAWRDIQHLRRERFVGNPVGGYLVVQLRSARPAQVTLPMQLEGTVSEQLSFLQEVHAWAVRNDHTR